MQTPMKESQPEAIPQNGNTPLLTTSSKSDCYPRPSLPRWRKTGQITSILKFGHITRRRFMELAHLARDPRIDPLVEDWDRMKPPLQQAVDLETLCEAHGVDATHFISVVGEAEMRFRDNASVILACFGLPDIVKQSIEVGMGRAGEEGWRDRRMLMQHSGFLPQPKGSQVRAFNYAAIRAEVNANIGEPLPIFEETIADSAEPIEDEE
jgi:hypothetical protein